MNPEATGFVRAQCRTALAALIRARIPDESVLVSRNEPRELLDRNIVLSDVVGNVDYPVSGSNLPRDDAFTVIVSCDAFVPGDDAEAAELAVQTLATAVMAAVAINPVAYDPLDGLVDGVQTVLVGAVNGPDVVPAAEGFGAVMTVAIDFHTRIVTP